jgi:hypothetical protein
MCSSSRSMMQSVKCENGNIHDFKVFCDPLTMVLWVDASNVSAGNDTFPAFRVH